MARGVHIPVRRSELLLLAEATRVKYRGLSIDEIADLEKIILVRMPSQEAKSGGYAYSEIIEDGGVRQVIDAIVINPLYTNAVGERVEEHEIFWHEFFHLWYSPSRIDAPSGFYEYSTAGVLHAQEERRATEFAAAVIVGTTHESATAETLAERYKITRGLAEIAIKL